MILTNGYSFPSAKLLRDALLSETGIKLLVTSNPARVKKLSLRYGNSEGTFNSVPNSPEFIRLCSNKLAFSKLLLEKGIPAPEYRKDKCEIFPALVRTSLFLSGGRGIKVVRNNEEFLKEWNSSYFWTPFRYCKFELRAHILGGNIVRLFKKIPDEEEGELPIRNNHSCHFSLREIENYNKVVNLVSSLSNFFGDENSFYALDMGWDDKNKEYFVFEANSAPGLNENTAQVYAEFLKEKI